MTMDRAERARFNPLPPCQWFALCDLPATTTRRHPVLGEVPICDWCNQKVEALVDAR